MSKAYFIVILPAVIVGVFYVAIYHGLGFEISLRPFLGTAVLFCAALIGVMRYQRRKQKRRSE